jgi:hypothetical protein
LASASSRQQQQQQCSKTLVHQTANQLQREDPKSRLGRKQTKQAKARKQRFTDCDTKTLTQTEQMDAPASENSPGRHSLQKPLPRLSL